jgi:SAF domain
VAIQTNRPSNRIFIVIGVILAAAAAIGVFLIGRNGSGSGNSVTVVVSTKAIQAGTQVTSDEVTTQSVDQSVVPTGSPSDVNSVIGKQFVNAVAPNTIITQSLFVTTTSVVAASSDTLPAITPGFVAMAIPAAPAGQPFSNGGPFTLGSTSGDQVSAGYYIAAGDHIDILVDNGNGVNFAFQDVRVLKAGAPSATVGAAVTYYVVELPRNQAEMMTYILVHSVTPSKTDSTQPANTQPGYPQIVKYVIRPTSEYGTVNSVDPSKSTYPKYEDTCPTSPNKPPYAGFACNSLPSANDANDPTVNEGTLQALFGH